MLVDDICTLIHVIIIDPTRADLVPQMIFFLRGWLWHCWLKWRKNFMKTFTQHMCFSFLPMRFLGVFINSLITFFNWCVNMVWTTKGTRCLVLYSFYKQRVSIMTLQKIHVISILGWTFVAKEASFKLKVLLGLPPLSLVDMLHMTNERYCFNRTLSFLWLALFGLLVCLDFGFCPLLFFSLFFWCFPFIMFGKVSSSSYLSPIFALD